jgi:hypothetical protein
MEHDQPERRRIVVDGSNIATEGRSLPSLAQLDEAIRSFLDEYKGFATTDVTVVVDASFGHRIDPSEVPAFEQAIEHGEMITPPAGAVGRGDGFILRIAEKSAALVLSNDSFQEFHAERPWLFEAGRLIGGKPVPGVGWIFTPRTPVRGAVSRSVTSKSKRESKAADGGGTESVESDGQLAPTGAARSGRSRGGRTTRAAKTAQSVEAASANGTGDVDAADQAPVPVKAAKATKAGKATKAAGATKAAKARKVSGTSTATKAAKVTKAAKKAKDTHDADDTYDDVNEPAVATRATRATKGSAAKAATSTKATKVAKATKAAKATASTKATRTTKATKSAKAIGPATATATAATGAPGRGGNRSANDGEQAPVPAAEALNAPLTFLTFVADHPVGSAFDGTVVSFTSHGAYVDVDGMLCHVPLRGLGDPPPNKARQVLTKGESRPFMLVSLDAGRRRAELVLPELAG